MNNEKIKKELLNKYLGQEKELFDFVKNDKEIYEKTLNKVEIDYYTGYYTVDFYIDQNSYNDLFELLMKEIYKSNNTEEYQNHLFDCLNKLEPISIDFQVTEKEMSVKDVYLDSYEEWDFEITLLKSLDYIFNNCNKLED
jgi:hypothetical protein